MSVPFGKMTVTRMLHVQTGRDLIDVIVIQVIVAPELIAKVWLSSLQVCDYQSNPTGQSF